MRGIRTLIIFMFITAVCNTRLSGQTVNGMPDKEQLTIALEYFSSGKYIEARNILTRLDKRYKLNPRFKAYIGLCFYYTWEYDKACRYLDPYIADLEVYAPHERSVYFFADAESHFLLEEYDRAIPLYEKTLTVCYGKEKGDVFFRLAYCYMNSKEWQNTLDCLDSALSFYEQFGYPEDKSARVIQIQKMIAGCKKKLKQGNKTNKDNVKQENTTEKTKMKCD